MSDRFAQPSPTFTPTPWGILEKMEAAQEGNRNATLFWAACRVWEGFAEGHWGPEVVRFLEIAAAATGLHPGEIESTIRSAYRTSGGR
jgi:hypothetical protein